MKIIVDILKIPHDLEVPSMTLCSIKATLLLQYEKLHQVQKPFPLYTGADGRKISFTSDFVLAFIKKFIFFKAIS